MRAPPQRLLFPVIMLGLLLGVAGSYLLLVVVVTDESVVRTTHRGVDELTVTSHNGDIEVVAAPAGAPVRVTRHMTESFESPRREESFDNGRLKLGYSCDDWPLGHCGIRYVVAVPPGVTVRATSGDGDVSAKRVASRRPMSLSSGSGDVEADSTSASRVALESGSGDVAVTGASAESLAVDAGSGDVVLDVAEISSSLRVDAGSGDVIVELPDLPYALRAQAPDGGLFNDGIQIDPRSPRRVDIDAGSGEVRLEPTG